MTIEPAKEKPTRVDWAEVHQRLALNQAALEQTQRPGFKDKNTVLKQRAKALARETATNTKSGKSLELVTFMLSDEKYGLESQYVREVYALKELTAVPCSPDFVLGITNVRGKILSVIDIKKFFDLPQKGLNELDKIVIVEFNHVEVGIHADSILGVKSITTSDLQPALPTLTGIREKYLKGVTPDRLVILNISKLLADPNIIVNEEVEG